MISYVLGEDPPPFTPYLRFHAPASIPAMRQAMQLLRLTMRGGLAPYALTLHPSLSTFRA